MEVDAQIVAVELWELASVEEVAHMVQMPEKQVAVALEDTVEAEL